MQSNLKHLTETQYTELSYAIKKITASIEAERIYSFGSRITQLTRWSPFHTGHATTHIITVSYYDLMLVLPNSDVGHKRKIAALPSRPTNACLTMYYHTLTSLEFTNRLHNNDPYVHHLIRDGLLLHHSGPPILSPEPIPCTAATSTFWWIKGINLAWQQYRKAVRAAERNDRWQVPFCLHRAAVETCAALIALHTGYRQQGRPLQLLLYYCDNFCLIRTRVFPCNTPEEAELLQQLERAAQTTGHDEALPITARVADTLLKRIHKMIEWAEELYRQKTGVQAKKMVVAT